MLQIKTKSKLFLFLFFGLFHFSINAQTTVYFESYPVMLNEDINYGNTTDICVYISSPDPTNDTSLDIIVSAASTADDGVDANLINPTPINFPAGTSGEQCFTVMITDDNLAEGNETLILEIANVTGGNNAMVGTYSTRDLIIFDNDNTNVAFDYSFSDYLFYENGVYGNTTATICVEIFDEDPSNSTIVEIDLYGAATDGVDFQSLGTQTLTFPAGSNTSECFDVTSIDDTDLEGDEYIVFQISNVTGGNAAGTIQYSDEYYIELKDDDNTRVSFAAGNNLSVDEGEGTVDVCFSITNPSTSNSTSVEIYPYGAAENGVDYATMGSPETLTFPAGSSADVCYTINITDDTDIEGDENIYLSAGVFGGDSGAMNYPSEQIITIIDNDIAPTTVEFYEYTNTDLNESPGGVNQVSICLSIYDADAVNDTEVDIAVSSTSIAQDGVDVQTIGTETIIFPAGSTTNECFDVFVIDDSDAEGNEELILEITNVTGGNNAVVGTIVTESINIFDNDNTNVGFSGNSDYVIHENISIGSVTADVCLMIQNEDPALDTNADVELHMYTSGTDGVDFQTIGVQSLTFPAGSNAEECFTVTAIDDTELEGYEDIYLTITNVSGGNATGLIQYNTEWGIEIKDDEATIVNFAASNATSVNEDAGTVDICFSISNPSSVEDTYIEFYHYGSITNGDDFTAIAQTENLIFPAGSSDDVCLTLTIIDDADVEGDEWFYGYFSVYGGSFATTGATDFQEILFIDNDITPTTVEFYQYNYLDATETGDAASVCIDIIDPSDLNDTQVEVAIGITSTAEDGVDFSSLGLQTFVFPAGTYSQKCFNVNVIDDALIEGLEMIVFDLQNVTGGNNAILGTKTQEIVNIYDDENTQVGFDYALSGNDLYEDAASGPSIVDICFYITNEDATNSTTASIDLGMYSDITDGVDIQTIGTQMVTFPAGSSASECFQIQIIDDAIVEGIESLHLEITNVSGGSFASASVYEKDHYLNVYDNEQTLIGFSPTNSTTFTESDGDIDVCLSIQMPSATNDTNVDVYFDLGSSSAENGVDFTALPEPISLTFPAGTNTDVCFTITPVEDAILEGNENLYFYIGNISGGDLATYGAMSYFENYLFDGSSGGNDGINCWDTNGDGINDPAEDTNMDLMWNALDCQGADGEDGNNGAIGPAGEDGINCWDTNGDGINDPAEDTNMDLMWNALDCQGEAGEDGATGPTGEPGLDGEDGSAGEDGINCWDTNGDGINDPAEDTNMDLMWNALDCQGADGADGIIGEQGEQGPQGIQGPQGEQGPAGDPATADGNGIYSGSGTVPTNTEITVTDNINFDENTLYIDGTSNKVGIGIDNPTHALDVMGDVGISGQIYGLSDERLKTNKVPMVNSLAIISKLIPNTYNFDLENYKHLNLSDKLQYGLLAQEVEEVLPAIVTEMKVSEGEEYKSINYNALISILVGAINEQQVTIEDQQKSFDEQAEKIKELERKLNLLLDEKK